MFASRAAVAGVVSQAGSVLLAETARKSGPDAAISAALAPWRKPRAVHDPGKILLDVALAVALGGDCLADVGMLRVEPAVFGPVASDPTVSRLIDTLAAGGQRALTALRAARAEVRKRAWQLAGDAAPDAGGEVIGHRRRPGPGALREAGRRRDQNQIWLEIIQIALDLLAWMPMLALTGKARRWEPRRLRLRLFSTAAQLITTGRRRILRFAGHWPWTDMTTDAPHRLASLPNPG